MQWTECVGPKKSYVEPSHPRDDIGVQRYRGGHMEAKARGGALVLGFVSFV